jgi:phosphoribosyl 1,2-cyclic phosphodiesterase/CheY-like chemotaxis protein
MKTVLLIDDDDFCRAPACAMLRKVGWNVIEAADGERGIELAIKHRPDVILCDLLMPRGNGYHVCRVVREQMELRHTKVVVITGRDFAADRQSADEAGVDDYLVKPIEFEKLREVLQRLVPGAPERNTAGPEGEDELPKNEAVRVKFWGVRGSIPTPGPTTVFFGGNTSCVEVRADGEIIILDAGSGIRPLGHALDTEFGERPIRLTILVTHTHWDHIQGFPFFLPAYKAKNSVHILGYEGARAGLASTLAGQMESPYFPIALKQMPGNIVIEELKDLHFEVGKVRVEACFSNHPGICVGYRLNTSAGSIVYLPDNEALNEQTGAAHGGALPRTIQQRLAQFVADADVLITDSQYSREEYQERIGWGHGCVDDVVKFAIEARVKRLYLFHHDPGHDDRVISGMLMAARDAAQKAGSALRIEASREGEQFTLARHVANVANAT